MPALLASLLDVDGTLVDSNDGHARSWVTAFADSGIAVSFERVRPFIGMGGDRLLREVAGLDEQAEPGKTIVARRKAVFAERELPLLQPTPGARELLLWLRDRGVQTVVATSATSEESNALVAAAGVEDLVDLSTTSDDASSSKPAPDILAVALEKAKASAAESVMIGDTPYDCEAARHAGVPVIALRCGGWQDGQLDADFVADDPADLLARWSESPLRHASRTRRS